MTQAVGAAPQWLTGTTWPRQVALQWHSWPRISPRLKVSRYQRAFRAKPPAQPPTRLNPPQWGAVPTPTEKTHLGNKALVPHSSSRAVVAACLMAHNNRCSKSTGIGKKRIARGFYVIVFNPNLAAPTQSAAKLINASFRGSEGMVKEKRELWLSWIWSLECFPWSDNCMGLVGMCWGCLWGRQSCKISWHCPQLGDDDATVILEILILLPNLLQTFSVLHRFQP